MKLLKLANYIGLLGLLLSNPATSADPVFVSPFKDTVKNTIRIGGASRGTNNNVALRAIEPIQTGLTTSPQPSLYWYISDIKDATIELTLTSEKSIDPVFEKQVKSPGKEGIYSIGLKKYNVKLEPGVNYFWAVSIITDPEQRSSDIVTGGGIKYVTPDPVLTTSLKNASQSERFDAYAKNGFWYDAINEISQAISKQPLNRELRNKRAILLKQVEITEAADYDIAAVK